MKVYFAHPITDYGTERQARAVRAIEAHRGNIVVENPDQPQHQEGYEREGMAYFERLVDDCWALAFMRFPDGSIGAGVGKEIKRAIINDKTVWEVFDGALYEVQGMPTPILSVEDTRATIRALRGATDRKTA